MDRTIAVELTTENMLPKARQVLSELTGRVDVPAGEEQTLIYALTDAFIEGVRWAQSEMSAQMIEQGINVVADVQIRSAFDPEDD